MPKRIRPRGNVTTPYRTPDGQYAKVAVDTDHHVLFVVKEQDGSTTEYYYGKETGKKIVRKIGNPFV